MPSSMFLMRILRSATCLSTWNFSLSDVTRRTIVWREKKIKVDNEEDSNI